MTTWPAVITTDAEGRITSWNREAEQLYGWAAGDAIGRRIEEVAVGPENAEVAAAIMSALAAGQAWQGEFRVQRKDGARVPAFVRDVPLVDLDGRVLGVIGLSFALDDRALLPPEVAAPAIASAQADAIVDTLLWNAPVGLALLDTGGRFVKVNAALADMTGLPVSAHLGYTALDLFPTLPHDEILRDFETDADRRVGRRP